jgi:hypothetical protein
MAFATKEAPRNEKDGNAITKQENKSKRRQKWIRHNVIISPYCCRA